MGHQQQVLLLRRYVIICHTRSVLLEPASLTTLCFALLDTTTGRTQWEIPTAPTAYTPPPQNASQSSSYDNVPPPYTEYPTTPQPQQGSHPQYTSGQYPSYASAPPPGQYSPYNSTPSPQPGQYPSQQYPSQQQAPQQQGGLGGMLGGVGGLAGGAILGLAAGELLGGGRHHHHHHGLGGLGGLPVLGPGGPPGLGPGFGPGGLPGFGPHHHHRHHRHHGWL